MEDPGLVAVSVPRHDPLPWYVALFTYCTRAALVGGIILTLLFFFSFVDIIAGAGPIVNEDEKPFNTGQHVFRYGAWCKL